MSDPHKNFAVSSVATAPSPATSGASLVLASGEGARFPQPSTDGAFNISIYPANTLPTPANAEIARCTARSTDTLTLIRAQEGTTARSVVVGDLVAAPITAKSLNDAEAGVELTYNEFTTSTTISATTSGTANTVVTASAFTFDGTAVMMEFFAPRVIVPALTGAFVFPLLFEDGSAIGIFASINNPANGSTLQFPLMLRRKMSPSAGSHTYSIRAYRDGGGTGTTSIDGGVGGSGSVLLPGYLKITKA